MCSSLKKDQKPVHIKSLAICTESYKNRFHIFKWLKSPEQHCQLWTAGFENKGLWKDLLRWDTKSQQGIIPHCSMREGKRPPEISGGVQQEPLSFLLSIYLHVCVSYLPQMELHLPRLCFSLFSIVSIFFRYTHLTNILLWYYSANWGITWWPGCYKGRSLSYIHAVS